MRHHIMDSASAGSGRDKAAVGPHVKDGLDKVLHDDDNGTTCLLLLYRRGASRDNNALEALRR